MNRQQYLLGKLAEEAAEVAQIALKTQQFGMEEMCPAQPFTNAERVHQELDDLFAIVDMLNREFSFNYETDEGRVVSKQDKVEKYYQYSLELGEARLGA